MPHRITPPSNARPSAPATPSTDATDVSPAETTPAITTPAAPAMPAFRGEDVFAAVSRTVPVTREAIDALLAGAGQNVALVPGRYPDAVSLPDVLRAAGASPQGRAMVEKLSADLEAKTGVKVPDAIKEAALRDPAVLTRALELTPAAMSRGMDAVNVAYRAGKLEQISERTLNLPQRFDLGRSASVALPRVVPELKTLAPGLLQGDLPSALPDAQLRDNKVMAEVLHRLSGNEGLPDAQRFSVTYGSSTFTRLDTFLDALRADGHDVEVRFEQRVANFSNLKTPVPGSDPQRYLDVPAPLLIRTGVVDSSGQEAVVPAVHAEMVIRIRKGAETRGPGMDADVKFYQGTSGTGFFPVGSTAEPSWCGKTTSAPLSGDDATRAVKLAGLFSDVVNDASKDLDLYMGGYGVTGVCNDSVAVIQHALTGGTTMYPLLMRDGTLQRELERRLSDANRRDDPGYRALSASIRALPSDAEPNATARERALSSLPWEPGREPLASSVSARKILGG